MWKNLVLLGISLLLTLAAAEFGLQRFTRLTDTLGEGRYLYFSENPWRRVETADDWVLTLQPNARIESFASYNGTEEYRYVLETNQFGFRETKCLSEGTHPVIPVLGDSYTQGTGGQNWLDEVNRILVSQGSRNCYMNAGVGGTGPESWIRTTKLLEEQFQPEFQLVVFITDDITRVHFFSTEKDGVVSFCFRVTGDSGDAEEQCVGLHIFTRESTAGNFESGQAVKTAWQRLLPATTELVARALNQNKNPAVGRFGDHDQLEQTLIRKLDRLTAAFDGETLVIRIPSKTDLMAGYRPFENVKNSSRLIYREPDCNLQKTDFHRRDEHPNKSGYARIAACVASEISRFEASLER